MKAGVNKETFDIEGGLANNKQTTFGCRLPKQDVLVHGRFPRVEDTGQWLKTMVFFRLHH